MTQKSKVNMKQVDVLPSPASIVITSAVVSPPAIWIDVTRAIKEKYKNKKKKISNKSKKYVTSQIDFRGF